MGYDLRERGECAGGGFVGSADCEDVGYEGGVVEGDAVDYCSALGV